MLWIETLKKKIQFPIKEMNSNTPFLLILSHIYIYIYLYNLNFSKFLNLTILRFKKRKRKRSYGSKFKVTSHIFTFKL